MIGTVLAQNQRIEQKVDNFDLKIRQNAMDIADLGDKLIQTESRVAKNVERIVDQRMDDFGGRLLALESGSALRGKSGKKEREEEAFWLARRSLRFSPIKDSDLQGGVADYVERILETDSEIIRALPRAAFKRAPSNRNAKIQSEVVVAFATPQDRDFYKSMAFRLAGKKDHAIRLELPNHLLGQHRVLSKAGQELRSSNQGCRTNIRFDEETMKLVLDFKTQGADAWKRVRVEQASAVVGQKSGSGIQETSEEDLRELLEPLSGANKTPLGS
jgi:hypothetical protein